MLCPLLTCWVCNRGGYGPCLRSSVAQLFVVLVLSFPGRSDEEVGEVIFASISSFSGDDSHDSGTPANDSIVKSGAHLGIHDMARPVRKLKREIELGVEIFARITEGSDETCCTNYLCGVEGGISTRAAGTAAAAYNDINGVGPDAALRAVAEQFVKSALTWQVPARVVDVKLIEDLCSNLNHFLISNLDTALANEERRRIGHVGHEVVQRYG
mmetsp:Transcript_19436/g.39345  ORF Transcript_19436/g.39345 Transcript_19436/m.39345 type:complete len:213 (+) Transcript_19436:504-1142(+)